MLVMRNVARTVAVSWRSGIRDFNCVAFVYYFADPKPWAPDLLGRAWSAGGDAECRLMMVVIVEVVSEFS